MQPTSEQHPRCPARRLSSTVYFNNRLHGPLGLALVASLALHLALLLTDGPRGSAPGADTAVANVSGSNVWHRLTVSLVPRAREPARAAVSAPSPQALRTALTRPSTHPPVAPQALALFHWYADPSQVAPMPDTHELAQNGIAAQQRQYRAMAMQQALAQAYAELAPQLHGEHTCALQADDQIQCDIADDVEWQAALGQWLALAVQLRSLGLANSVERVSGPHGSLRLQWQPVDPVTAPVALRST